MTTEKDKDQTRQNPSSENQDPNGRPQPTTHPTRPPAALRVPPERTTA